MKPIALSEASILGAFVAHLMKGKEMQEVKASKFGKRGVLVDGRAIKEARKAKGFVKREQLLKAIAIANEVLGRDTLRRYEKSPNPQAFAFLSKLEGLARILDKNVDDFVLTDDGQPFGDIVFRDCSGLWKVEGHDIKVKGHFDYPNGPRQLSGTAAFHVAKDRRVSALGIDQDGDEISLLGSVNENGNTISGQYCIENPRLHGFGTIMLQYESCGRKMSGYYIGRETGHGQYFVFAHVTMNFIRPFADGESIQDALDTIHQPMQE